uniref:Uncharacterized protein n=1 Tax=Knipowitschia caucasica TaxID=637954 RepID=A0AAV2KSN7_KNICA
MHLDGAWAHYLRMEVHGNLIRRQDSSQSACTPNRAAALSQLEFSGPDFNNSERHTAPPGTMTKRLLLQHKTRRGSGTTDCLVRIGNMTDPPRDKSPD